jgi:hypothetical protein
MLLNITCVEDRKALPKRDILFAEWKVLIQFTFKRWWKQTCNWINTECVPLNVEPSRYHSAAASSELSKNVLTDYDGVRPLQNSGHPPGDMWAWSAMVMMQAGDNYWLVHQSSLAVQQRYLGQVGGRRSENFAYLYLRYLSYVVKSYDTGHPALLLIRRKVCCGCVIALRNLLHRLSLNPWPLGPVASTLTTTPPRRLKMC